MSGDDSKANKRKSQTGLSTSMNASSASNSSKPGPSKSFSALNISGPAAAPKSQKMVGEDVVEHTHSKPKDKLLHFFLHRPSPEELIKKKLLKEESEHSKNLGGALRYDVVEVCAKWVENHSMNEEGIYRLSAPSEEVKQTQELFKKNLFAASDLQQLVDSKKLISPHTVACALKKYVRDSEVPIIPFDLYLAVLDAAQDAQKLKSLLNSPASKQSMPSLNRQILHLLIQHFINIVARETSNKMSVQGISNIWAPALLRAKELNIQNMAQENLKAVKAVSTLMENVSDIFAYVSNSSSGDSDNSSGRIPSAGTPTRSATSTPSNSNPTTPVSSVTIDVPSDQSSLKSTTHRTESQTSISSNVSNVSTTSSTLATSTGSRSSKRLSTSQRKLEEMAGGLSLTKSMGTTRASRSATLTTVQRKELVAANSKESGSGHASVRFKVSDNSEAIFKAIKHGDIHAARKLLDSGNLDKNALNSRKQSILHALCRAGMLSVVLFVLQHKLTNTSEDKDYVNSKDYKGNTALMYLCRASVASEMSSRTQLHAVIGELINRGANVLAINGKGNTVLHKARCFSTFYLLSTISSKNLGFLEIRNSRQWTPLHFAIKSDDRASVEFLLQYGANLYISQHSENPTAFDADPNPYQAMKIAIESKRTHLLLILQTMIAAESQHVIDSTSLGPEIWRKIISFIPDGKSLCRVSRVCKMLRRLSGEETHWQSLFQNEFPTHKVDINANEPNQPILWKEQYRRVFLSIKTQKQLEKYWDLELFGLVDKYMLAKAMAPLTPTERQLLMISLPHLVNDNDNNNSENSNSSTTNTNTSAASSTNTNTNTTTPLTENEKMKSTNKLLSEQLMELTQSFRSGESNTSVLKPLLEQYIEQLHKMNVILAQPSQPASSDSSSTSSSSTSMVKPSSAREQVKLVLNQKLTPSLVNFSENAVVQVVAEAINLRRGLQLVDLHAQPQDHLRDYV